jgi:hypothetical protein
MCVILFFATTGVENMSFNPIEFSCELFYVLYSVCMKGKQIQLDLDYHNKFIFHKAFNDVNWLMFQIELYILRFQGSGGS